MKQLAKLLAVFMIAVSVFAQQQVQPVAGVLTLNLVPGTTSFKVIIAANITSVVILNPTPGSIISVIFTENATGGFTVAFGGNIASPCTVTTTANATTICQFQYDSTNNQWTGIGGGGGGSVAGITPIYVSTNCGTLTISTTPPCYAVNANVQYAITPSYSAGGTGGSTATILATNDNDSGAQFIASFPATSNFGSQFTGSIGAGGGGVLAAFKTAGTPSFGTCVSSGDIGPGTSAGISITATGGSGHMILAYSRAGLIQSAITFSDNSGQNTWQNSLSSPSIGLGITGQLGYTTNAKAGTYTITASWATSSSNNSIFACEVSNIATANVLDASIAANSGDTGNATTYYAGTITTTQSDLVIHAVTQQGLGGTYTAGTIGLTPNTITTQSTDPPFSCPGGVFPCTSGGDVGKKVFVTSNCNAANGFVDCVQDSPFANTTIAIVNSAHNITPGFLPLATSTAAAAGTPGLTGYLVWGSEDGPTLAAAFAKAITLPNATLLLPCGIMMFNTAPFVISASTFLTYNPNIAGCQGTGGTIFVPSPDYAYGSASGGLFFSYPNTNRLSTNAGTQGPFFYSAVDKFMVWGAGSTGLPASAVGAPPIFNLNLVMMRDVDVVSWGRGGNAPPNAINGNQVRIRNVHLWSVGTGIQVNSNGLQGEPSTIQDTFILSSAKNALLIQGGHLVTSGLTLVSSNSTCAIGASAVQQTGGDWSSTGDVIDGFFSTGGSANIRDNIKNAIGVCSDQINNAGGKISAQNSRIDTFTQSSGTFTDLGGNYVTAPGTPWTNGTLTVSGGTVISTGSITGVAITAPKLVLSAGWGTTAAWTSLSGFTKRIQGTITASGTGQAANPTITYTFPTPFAQATNIVCKGTQISGTQAAVANPFTVGVPTATSVVFTYTGTPGAGNTLQVILECDAT